MGDVIDLRARRMAKEGDQIAGQFMAEAARGGVDPLMAMMLAVELGEDHPAAVRAHKFLEGR